jgi:2-phospho-L-lactate/phosphoenolpyruvate guanylyltransferase
MDPMSSTAPRSPAPGPIGRDGAAPEALWRLIVPVKGAPDAKSRLRVEPGIARIDLARAMALDTIEAALASPAVGSVLVVSSDSQVAAGATRAGAQVEPDPGTGLNDAVRRGRDRLAAEGDGRVAVLLADLPALRARDLSAALEACGRHRSAYVPDAEGTGTVLLTAARPDLLEPAFGADSAQRHNQTARREELDLPRLRRDVDLAASLSAARALGLRPRTAAVLAEGAREAGR